MRLKQLTDQVGDSLCSHILEGHGRRVEQIIVP